MDLALIEKKKTTPVFHFGNASDTGLVREHNEDYYGYFSTPLGEVFVVCDGMGGHNGGEIASRLAVETINSFFKTTMPSSPEKLLKTSIEKANTAIWSKASEQVDLAGMGTTIVILYFPKNSSSIATIAHVGDSRIYRIRNKVITRLTEDHSKVMMLVKLGIISLEEAAYHPQKNIITRALGIAPNVDVEINQIEVNKSDRYILCSDGITDLITDKEILSTSEKAETQPLAEQLINKANSRGGHDNSTVQVIDIPGASITGRPIAAAKEIMKKIPRIRINKRMALLATPVILLLITLIVLSTGGSPDLTSEYHEVEYLEESEPAYIITITTDTANTIEFENTSISETTDTTFIIQAMDLNPSPDKTTLYYTVSGEEDQRRDSLTIQNDFETAYLNHEFQPPDTTKPVTHLILEIDTTQTEEHLQITIPIEKLRQLFPEDTNGIIDILAPIQITGNRLISYSDTLQEQYNLPYLPVDSILSSYSENGSILEVRGITLPAAGVRLGESERTTAIEDGYFTIPIASFSGIDSLQLTFEHPCYRTTTIQVQIPEEPIERFIPISDERTFRDTETELEWCCGPDTNMTFREAESWKNDQDSSWRFPTEDQLKGLPDSFVEEQFSGTIFWIGQRNSLVASVFSNSSNQVSGIGIDLSADKRIILVREVQ